MLFSDIHKNIGVEIRQNNFEQALKMATENHFYLHDTIATNMLMAQIYTGLFKKNHRKTEYLDKAVELADKIVLSEMERGISENYEPFFKIFRVAARAYNEKAIHERIEFKKQLDHDPKAISKDSVHFSEKALNALGNSEILIKEQKDLLNKKLSEHSINILGAEEISNKLAREQIEISNTKIETAFAKNSPKLALTFLNERRETFGLHDKKLFNGLDAKYFLNQHKAFVGLKQYDRASDISNFLVSFCLERHLEAPTDLLGKMNRNLQKHLEHREQPTPELKQNDSPIITLYKNIISKVEGFIKSLRG